MKKQLGFNIRKIISWGLGVALVVGMAPSAALAGDMANSEQPASETPAPVLSANAPAEASPNSASSAEASSGSASSTEATASPSSESSTEAAECLSLYDFFVDVDSSHAILQFSRSYRGEVLTEINEATQSGKAGDATDCRNVLRALDTIRDLNEVRASLGLNELLVSDELMALETVNVNWSTNNIAHSTGCGAENLAWGWDKPVDGWYGSEKIIWDQAVETGTYKEAELPDGWQTMSASQLSKKAPEFYQAVGHYLNCINPNYTAVGAACNTIGNIARVTMGQNYRSVPNDATYTVDEWEARLRAWMAEQDPVYVPVAKPAPKTLTYNGRAQVPLAGSDAFSVEGQTSATDAGTYHLTVSLNEGYCWSDGTRDDLDIAWEIQRQKVAKPTCTAAFTYTGSQRTAANPSNPPVKSYSGRTESPYTYSGTRSATAAGTYVFQATLNGNYQWADGSIEPLSFTWTIEQPVEPDPGSGEGGTVDPNPGDGDETPDPGEGTETPNPGGSTGESGSGEGETPNPGGGTDETGSGSGEGGTGAIQPGEGTERPNPGGSAGESGSDSGSVTPKPGTGSGALNPGNGSSSASGSAKPAPAKPAPAKPAPAKPVALSIARASVSVADAPWVGKTLKPKAISVVLNGKTLRYGADYTFTCKGGKAIGSYAVAVKGVGSYTGTVAARFNIVPKSVKAKKPAAGKRSFTAKWARPSSKFLKQTSGYQVQWSTDKNFKKAVKSKTVKGAKKTSLKVSKLKAKKTYYVRVCAYKQVGKVKYCSAWSKVQKVRAK